MDEHRHVFAFVLMARVLLVSRSGYYRWWKIDEPGRRAQAREELDVRVRELFERHRSRYGAPRIIEEPRELRPRCDEKTVAASLGRQGLRARSGRRQRAVEAATADSGPRPSRVHSSLGGKTPTEVSEDGDRQHAELRDYRWESHCDGLFMLPIAA
jgi:transposase InsO family protein